MLVAVYKAFVGLLLAAFVGIGISAAAPEPRFPEPPARMMAPERDSQPSPEAQREFEEFQNASRAHRVLMAEYSRNASAVAAIAAITMLILSLTVLRRVALFSDGFLLGGIVTFAYSVVRGFGAEDNTFRFIVVALGLAIALVLGYVRFVRPTENAARAGPSD